MLPATDTPLFSQEAEQAVLGGLMVSPVNVEDVAALVHAHDFAAPEHSKIFTAILTLAKAGQPVDILTVGVQLKTQFGLDTLPYLAVLARDTASVANIIAYAGVIRSYSQRRRLLDIAHQLATWATELPDASQTLANLKTELDRIESGQSLGGPRALADIMPSVLDELDARSTRSHTLLGQSTGLSDVDTLLDGLCPGRLYTIAGRPGSGKSVFGLQVARQVVSQGKRALLVTLEMPAQEVVHRLFAAEMPLELGKINAARLSESEWGRLAACAISLSPVSLWIDDSSQMNIADLLSRARRLHRIAPLDLVVVDYIGLLDAERGGGITNRVQEMGVITRALKALAKDLNLPVVALAQLNRTLEGRADKRPILSDLRESGSVEQDSDVVACIYRDELHHEDSPDKGCAEFIVRKNRSGKTGTVPLLFDGEHCRFKPIEGGLPSKSQPPTPPPDETFGRRVKRK